MGWGDDAELKGDLDGVSDCWRGFDVLGCVRLGARADDPLVIRIDVFDWKMWS